MDLPSILEAGDEDFPFAVLPRDENDQGTSDLPVLRYMGMELGFMIGLGSKEGRQRSN